MWLEKLPENCPPDDAKQPSNFLCFRLASKNPPDKSDYYSHRKLYPSRKFRTSECRARSITIFNDKSKCLQIKKLAVHKNKELVSLRLFPGSGLIKQTGEKAHYSWWVMKDFLAHIVIEG